MEFVVTLIVIGILAAALYSAWPGKQVNANLVAHQVATDIRYVQTLALSRDRNYMITFTNNTTPNTYVMSRFTSGSPVDITHPFTNTTTVSLPVGITLSLPAAGNNAQVDSGLPNNLINFNSEGEPYVDQAGTVPLAGMAQIGVSSDGKTFNVCLHPNTGLVEVQTTSCS